jgi:hypothetical protein
LRRSGERLTEKQQFIIDHIQRVGPDILGEVLEKARMKKKA